MVGEYGPRIRDFIKNELDKFTAEREEYKKLRSGIESGNIEGIIAGQLAPGINVALSKARGVENTPLISKFLARTSKNLSSLKYNDSPKADLGKPAPYRPRVKTKDFYK